MRHRIGQATSRVGSAFYRRPPGVKPPPIVPAPSLHVAVDTRTRRRLTGSPLPIRPQQGPEAIRNYRRLGRHIRPVGELQKESRCPDAAPRDWRPTRQRHRVGRATERGTVVYPRQHAAAVAEPVGEVLARTMCLARPLLLHSAPSHTYLCMLRRDSGQRPRLCRLRLFEGLGGLGPEPPLLPVSALTPFSSRIVFEVYECPSAPSGEPLQRAKPRFHVILRYNGCVVQSYASVDAFRGRYGILPPSDNPRAGSKKIEL